MATINAIPQEKIPAHDLLLMGLDGNQPLQVRQALEKGLPYRAWENFEKISTLQRRELLVLLGISESTLLRRQKDKRLDPEESDRLYRVANLYRELLKLFHGDSSAANTWLRSPHAVFGHETPLSMAKSDYGSRQVELLIQRLIHGVYV